MIVDVLYFEGCPSYEALLPRLRELVAEAGLGEDAIALHLIASPQQAEEQRFLGSPTVRVDAVDVDPESRSRDDFGIKCRIYRSAEGQAHVPPEDWLRAALGIRPRTTT